jgi:hypothetical protein
LIPGRGNIFLFFNTSTPALRPTQLIQRVPSTFPPRVKRQRREADRSSPSNAEVRNSGAIPPLPHASSLVNESPGVALPLWYHFNCTLLPLLINSYLNLFLLPSYFHPLPLLFIFNYILSRDIVTIDGVWIYNWIYWTHKTRDYTSQTTITHRLVFSATPLSNGFQRRTFICFRAHVLASLRPFHSNPWTAGFRWYFLQLLAPGLNSPTAASRFTATSKLTPYKVSAWLAQKTPLPEALLLLRDGYRPFPSNDRLCWSHSSGV